MISEAEAKQVQTVLQRAVRRLCPRWAEAEREDLVQTALLKLHQRNRGEENPQYQASYLYRVAHSIVVDEVRKKSRRPVTSDGLSPEIFSNERHDQPDQVALAEDAKDALWDCMGRLAESRRTALALYLQGHSVPEASRLLGWPDKRTENCVYRGLANLRDCLKAKGVDHVIA